MTASPTRRTTLGALALLATTALTGCYMSSKRNIRTLDKTFSYLKDPALRTKEKGDARLVVEGAELSGERFEGMDWHNILFKNCDFVGAYEINPKTATNVRYEDCRFSGILSYGVTTNVHFLRCAWVGNSVMFAEKGSKSTVFEECNFVGTTANRNHQGAVGSDGEAEFVRCRSKWFAWTGNERLSITDCTCEDVTILTDSIGNSGEDFLYAATRIEGSKLRGTFKLVAANLQSLTIRDTVIDMLDLTSATIKEELLMERVRGGSVEAIVKGAKRLVVRDSQFTPPASGGKFIFSLASNDAQEVLIENTSILGDNILVDIGGGPHTESLVFRKSKFPRLDLQYAHAKHLLLENFEANSVRLNDARIGKLELSSAVFALTLDLSNTQVHEFKKTGGTDLKKLGGLKLDGSNINLPQ
ncbi:hypothetical protein [Variovorax sp. YR752]|uniref:hypothetical protein n=1 Tax=Variovorax sp. YR752 TaxID=1884383 RepID=UPI00313791D1